MSQSSITFRCPECEQTSRLPLLPDQAVECPSCHWRRESSAGSGPDRVAECCVCGCRELFLRKNFSQRLGVTIVATAAICSTIAWAFHLRYLTFAILFAAAALDLVLYLTVGNLLQCYRCHAEYRGLSGLDDHAAFSLETHERFRQQAIRLAEHQAANAKGA